MSKLSLSLLGSPEVRHAGKVLTFPTRKTFALLVYLAVERGVHFREKLMTLFWPESDDVRGRGSLRNTLGYLRTALNDGSSEHFVGSNAEPRHLIIERDTLSFNFTSACHLDLHPLEAAFTLVRTFSTMQNQTGDARHHLLTQLQGAVDLYRGGFLEGFFLDDAPTFDDWVSFQRDMWHRRVSLLFDRLSQLQFEGGEPISAIETATRWVALDPLNEAAYQRVMRIHFAMGNREAALRAYDMCRATLRNELQTWPTPTTKALAERIRTMVPHRSAPHEDGSRSPLPPPVLLEGPFVGRGTEYSKLVESYYRISKGLIDVVSLEGEAGIGKTRLATEFLGWAVAQGADILQGQAFEAGGRVPYQPLVEALRRRLEHEHALDDLLSDVWLAELSRLLPELRDRYPDLSPPPGEETVARTRIFETIARLGQALSRQASVVLFIDDVQWADAASLDALHYVSRRWAESGTPVLLLVGIRSEAVMMSPLLTDWLSSLGRNLSLTRLMLEPLTLNATLLLVQSLASEVPNNAQHASPDARTRIERFGRWLFAETGGQPFFIMETLKALLEDGVLTLHVKADGAWVVAFESALLDETLGLPGSTSQKTLLPARVREVIRTRLARLSSAAFEVLAAGSVLGQGFSFEHLCRVTDVGENAGLSSLDEVLRSYLLYVSEERVGPGAEVSYSFTHEKIRDVVYIEAGEARRRIFHRRAFEALLTASAPAAQLAHHAHYARLLEPTFHWSLSAGDDAMRLFAVRDALVHYEQAEWVLTEWSGEKDRQLVDISVADVQHLYIQLGRTHELSSDYHKAQDVYDAMLTFARERQEPTMECAALNRLALLSAWKSYDVERAGMLLQEALGVAEGSGDRAGLAETEWNLAQMSFYTFRTQEARIHAERALTVAYELDLQDLIARSLNVLAWVNLHLGNLQEVIVRASEAQARYVTMGNRAMEADCLNLLALARLHIGLPQEALRAARTAQAISIEIENAWGQMVSANNLALALRESGEYGEALGFARQGATIARTLGFPPNLMINLFMLGLVQGTMLALSASRTTLLEATALNEEVKSRPHGEALAEVLCMNAVIALEWQEAYVYARQARAARNYRWSYGWHLTLWYETEALLRGGDVAQAEEEVRHFGEYMKDNRRYRLPYLQALAVLAQWKNETGQALTHLQEAVRLAEEIGLPGERWHILVALGDLHLVRGDEEQARPAFIHAAEVVQSLASNMEDEQLRMTFLSAVKVQRVLQWVGWPG